MAVRVRFAPSPTGLLHLGGLRTALYNYLFAHQRSGKFILRIEDTDQTRLVPGSIDNLLKVLEWTGLNPDEGPGTESKYGPYLQSQRRDLYHEMDQSLIKSGHAYKCFCTEKRLRLLRKTQISQGKAPKYDNKCRYLTQRELDDNRSHGVPCVTRLKIERTEERWDDLVYGKQMSVVSNEGDTILMKSDGFPTYHFANVVDDHHMAITHVLRGSEWQTSTGKHLTLYKAFGWKPPLFAHLPLIMNVDGTKLSKRQDDITVQHYMDMNFFPESVLNLVTSSGGGFTNWEREGCTLQDYVKTFDISMISKHPAMLNFGRLNEYNRAHLQMKLTQAGSLQSLIDDVRAIVAAKQSDRTDENIECLELKDDYIRKVLDWSKTRIYRPIDLLHNDFLFLWFVPSRQNSINLLTSEPRTPDIVDAAIGHLSELDNVDESSQLSDNFKALSKSIDVNYPTFMVVIRRALSGFKVGPSVNEIISVLGKETSLERLKQVPRMLHDKWKRSG